MSTAKLTKTSIKSFYPRGTLAKKIGKPITTLENMLFRGVISPDAWVVELHRSQPLFDCERVEEIKRAINAYGL
jgi:hypothetical protein